MLNEIETIKVNMIEYIGEGMYLSIYLIGLIYIYLTEKNKKIKYFFINYSLFCFFIVLNPFFCKAVSNMITRDVYWRMFWIFPIGLTIAYCSTKLIMSNEIRKEKIKLFIFIIIIIIISGKFIYNKENYFLSNNLYKLPNEELEVCIAISKDNLDNKLVMAPPEIIPYFRQYDASIKLMYGRMPNGYDDNELVVEFNKGNMKEVIPTCLQKNCQYIVVKNNVFLNENMNDFGYKLMGNTQNYLIYRLSEKYTNNDILRE